MRYVAFPYCRPWVIHIYKNVRGRSAISKEGEKLQQEHDHDILHDKDEAEPCRDDKENKTEAEPEAMETDVNSDLSKQTDEPTSSEHLDGMSVCDSKQKNISSFGREKITTEGMDVSEMPSKYQESSKEEAEILSKEDLEMMEITSTAKYIADKRASYLEKVDTKKDMDNPEGSSSTEMHEPVPSKDTEDTDIAIRYTNFAQKDAFLSEKDKDVTQVMDISEGSSKDKPSQELNKGDTEQKRRTKRKANMFPPPAPVSTYETVRHIMLPWKKPEGVLNRPIMRMMLESLMLYIMAKPGISETKLFGRFCPHFQPATVCNLIEMLEKVGCIEKKFIRSRKASLFSAVTLPEEVSDHREGDVVLYFPTVNCVQALGQLACKVYDRSSFTWPTPDKYSDSKPTHISAIWTTLPS